MLLLTPEMGGVLSNACAARIASSEEMGKGMAAVRRISSFCVWEGYMAGLGELGGSRYRCTQKVLGRLEDSPSPRVDDFRDLRLSWWPFASKCYVCINTSLPAKRNSRRYRPV